MLKVFAQTPGAQAPDTHVFTFPSATTARAEADAIRDALSKAIQAVKTGGVPAPASGGASAAMAIARAISSKLSPSDANAIYDDEKLKQDAALQQSLLKANPPLSKTFTEALKTKPESISISQFSNQFWSSRVHLLRSHAIDQSQKTGQQYNVLSTIKPVTVDDKIKLSLSKEQVQMIFKQHPLVKRVYDENVPKLSEGSFWSRFFVCRLYKKMKGERILDGDPTDAILDKYLVIHEEERATDLLASHIPHTIDIEGNEQNHSQRKGNDGDSTMRPSSLNKAPIIRTLNSLAEKVLSQVAPNDIDPSEPIGVDEETYNELRLRDLQGDAEERRNILNIKDQSRFFASEKETDVSKDALRYAKQDPTTVLKTLRADIKHARSLPDLSMAIGINEDSDSSEDEATQKNAHVGSKAALTSATAQLLGAISEQRLQTDDADASKSTSGLHKATYERLTLTHATTTEFLSYFWAAFLSGNSTRAEEISRLVETLNRAMDRIKAVAEDAEKERQKEIDKYRKQADDFFQRTGRKRRVDEANVPGGAKAVNQLFAPTVKAIEAAGRKYRKALEEQAVDNE